eukprot:TRINITY_DN14576_c0_g1_i1.p1 TRINITY_DN14576_c0_g1~~TRINITY_DN14576_c0_g1_i1.p1  ORF type:complete len:675 (+),score=206.14 TRINITY_DN14576_c0_g1_i1:201-2027(+)
MPILISTSAGADPCKELEELAEKEVGRDRYQEVAMGGGQQEVAVTLLRAAAQAGDWLCLKNLHLVVAWLPALEKELSALKPQPSFRLWLTTEPHAAFPPVLLQSALKVTFESPPGVKKNLQRTYTTWTQETLGRNPVQAQLLFLLAWFHAVVQERRTYCPQGWTKAYEFSLGDLRAGAMVIAEACAAAARKKGGGDGGGAIDWDTVHGLMEDAIYGGRVESPHDMEVLRTHLRQCFSPELLEAGPSGRGGELAKGIRVPVGDSLVDYEAAVARMPDTDAPALFGLPGNIERSVQRAASAAVLSQLGRLAAVGSAAAKFDREAWRRQLGPLLTAWEGLSAGSVNGSAGGAGKDRRNSGGAARRPSGTAAEMTPVAAFVAMEEAQARDLVAHVDASLQAIKRVLYGTGLLTPAIQATGGALMAAKVPSDWTKRWEGPESPQAWLSGLMRRRQALARWLGLSACDALLDTPINLSDLFNPNTFLNAVRQQSARLAGCAMDTLTLATAWESVRLRGAKMTVAVDGLRLQGAAFSGGTLRQQSANDPDLTSMPTMHLAYIPRDQAAPHDSTSSISAPLYFALDRERVLCDVSLPTQEHHDKWVLAACALFLAE